MGADVELSRLHFLDPYRKLLLPARGEVLIEYLKQPYQGPQTPFFRSPLQGRHLIACPRGRSVGNSRKTTMRTRAILLFLGFAAAAVASDTLPGQLIVSIAPDWNSSAGKLQLFERSGDSWRAVSGAMPVLYGK